MKFEACNSIFKKLLHLSNLDGGITSYYFHRGWTQSKLYKIESKNKNAKNQTNEQPSFSGFDLQFNPFVAMFILRLKMLFQPSLVLSPPTWNCIVSVLQVPVSSRWRSRSKTSSRMLASAWGFSMKPFQWWCLRQNAEWCRFSMCIYYI